MGHGVVAQRPYFVVVGQINPFKNERPIGLQNHPQSLNGPWGKRHRMFLLFFMRSGGTRQFFFSRSTSAGAIRRTSVVRAAVRSKYSRAKLTFVSASLWRSRIGATTFGSSGEGTAGGV